MKRMLINATHTEELRVALVDGQRLYDLDIEIPSKRQYKSNIYKGKITKIEPSLEAAFIDYGMPRQGFLPLKEVAPQYFSEETKNTSGKPNIADVLKEGQELLVQVEKEERGNKGAALTTFISLPGRFLVLMPNNPSAGGISRRVDGDERKNLREALKNIDSPENSGVIARTAAIGKTEDELRWDLEYLHKLWLAIDQAWQSKPAPFLVYQDNDVIIRTLRDYLSPEIAEIITDDIVTYNNTLAFMQQVMPNHADKLKHYSDSTPLFSRFRIESQIEKAFQREVNLRSGGSIVIDVTEAMIAIDINSARATKGGDIEETALNTNLEAADEIARQLRLRDLGGLIVIDFIDMMPARNIKEVEAKLKEVVKQDRARIQIGKISRFGLLEMSRQRLRPALAEQHQSPCPTCKGHGVVRTADSLAISILRQLEEELIKQSAVQMVVQLPVDVATYILNEKRSTLSTFEARYKTHLVVIPNKSLAIPEFHFKRTNKGVQPKEATSFSQSEEYNKKAINLNDITNASPQSSDTPMVQGIHVERVEMPVVAKKPEGGLIKRLLGSLFSSPPEEEEKKPKPTATAKKTTRSSNNNRKRSNSNRNRQNKQNRDKTENTNAQNNKKDQGNRKNQRQDQNPNKQEKNAHQQTNTAKVNEAKPNEKEGNSNKPRRPRRRPKSLQTHTQQQSKKPSDNDQPASDNPTEKKLVTKTETIATEKASLVDAEKIAIKTDNKPKTATEATKSPAIEREIKPDAPPINTTKGSETGKSNSKSEIDKKPTVEKTPSVGKKPKSQEKKIEPDSKQTPEVNIEKKETSQPTAISVSKIATSPTPTQTDAKSSEETS